MIGIHLVYATLADLIKIFFGSKLAMRGSRSLKNSSASEASFVQGAGLNSHRASSRCATQMRLKCTRSSICASKINPHVEGVSLASL